VSFASPWFLLALLVVPAVLGLLLVLERRRARYTVAFTNLEVLASVAGTGRRPARRWVPLALFLLALASASAALARPRAVISQPASRATVVLLVDVSGSMRAADVRPTRLGAAQHAMAEFVDRIPGSVKVGLVTFSTGPNILVIPTTDRSALHEGIDLLVPEAGTALGDGLNVAVRVARAAVGGASRDKSGKIPGAIVLLSDGAQTRGILTPLQAAARAKAAGIRVYTIALGTDHGTLGFGPFGLTPFGGRRFPVKPDPVPLAAIARVTGGQTYRANTAAKADAIYKHLGSSIAHRSARREISSWFTGAAALLLLGSLGAARVSGARLP